jgi:hypothetical protein
MANQQHHTDQVEDSHEHAGNAQKLHRQHNMRLRSLVGAQSSKKVISTSKKNYSGYTLQ